MPKIVYKNAEGVRLPGVTTVLGNLGWSKGALMTWANRIGVEEGVYHYEYTEALDVGTAVHDRLKVHVLEDTSGWDWTGDLSHKEQMLCEQAFQSWLQWYENQNIKALEVEHSLVSEEFQFGGTIDLVGWQEGTDKVSEVEEHFIKTGPYIYDWKSSNGIYEDHLIQVRAYKELWDENYPETPIQGCHVVRIGKTSGMFMHAYYDTDTLEPAWEVFQHALRLHQLHKQIRKLT